MLAFLCSFRAHTQKTAAKVLQKMHIRKKSEKFYKKIIDFIYLYRFHRAMGACS